MCPAIVDAAEERRLNESRTAQLPWKKWGPYLSERQWGTVREDYSGDGDAWRYFTHDQSRSRTYRWGEDGIGGLCDDKQRLCFALAVWNGHDPILKERLFGLTNSEGNHGEDVKEYYFYVDSTPTHSYMKYLYKYPQREYPYQDLVETNGKRSRGELEYELLDTGIFDDDRYFDVFVEYAKAAPEDIFVRVTVHNRAREGARLRVLPTLWFRNTWSWGYDDYRPSLCEADSGVIRATHRELGEYWLYCDGETELLFTENESNARRLWNQPNASPYVKDAFHAYVIDGQRDAVNPARAGTKAAAHYACEVPAGGAATIRLRLSAVRLDNAFDDFERTFDDRVTEADAFYERIAPTVLTDDERRVHRQALAGMLWSKQYYYFDLERWLREHQSHPLLEASQHAVRNTEWFPMLNADVISMPDKWEYPWFAAWDLAFHTIALASVDFDFAKEQLLLMLRILYLHPSGQIPAYEWNFSDVNPPVHAAATLWLYKYEKALGRADPRFLERSFQGLMLNFNWWVNRKDPSGRSVFAGGFLGLDNIGVFDRSAQLPTGGSLEQADGTAWMAFYCQSMLEMAMLLAEHDPMYEEIAFKFVQHFMWIAYAMNRLGDQPDDMWDEQDGFFYDLLRLPDGQTMRLRVRSMVGLLPLCASTVFEADSVSRCPRLMELIAQFRSRYPELLAHVAPTDAGFIGHRDRRLLSILNTRKLERVLGYLLDENEFLGPYGIRSLSRYHLDHPYTLNVGGQEYKVQYLPAESNTGMFGGNSNWRGPVWMPVNLLIVRALTNLYGFFGDEFKVQCPTGSGQMMTLFEVAQEIVRRLTGTFLRGVDGRRPVYGGTGKFQDDPHWRDLILFYEYFHGDNGAGLGASHQTGWTGLVAPLLDLFRRIDAQTVLESDRWRVKAGVVGQQMDEGR
ncbi:glucosidase [Paraburkholderia sp. CNPSo 3281]|uniref:MGH1-like glycoside hydrolase domain-containing protein n=1 Tax=Paraburkholderia sp. CNPSo 3281 TaxID=2940933 RepID=UPI0020B685CF|nr:glucosidase [Paraburkholderia sp. CNPSo 3281]MCP3716736.1 glucosidase [Paraburkholderia sp. CNPSo 3281]